LKRVADILAYGVAAAALLGGVGYGWRQLTSPPPMPPVPPLNEAAARLPPIPEPAPAPPAPAPVQAEPGPRPTPDPAVAQAAEDRQVYQELRRNCYEAAANNSNGEYPGLQAAACDRYAQFAGQHGWTTGALPGYAQAAPPQQAVAEQPYSAGDQNGNPPQVVYLGPVYDAGLTHHRPPRQPQNDEQPQGPIGPNYAPPPMQQPPPVSQHHSPSRPATPPRTH
jgi:hypothetical protein